MFNGPRTERIFGPPGTGKTSSLMLRLEQELEAGVDPYNICLVAFTRSASNEAKTRAARKFDLDYKELRNFSTIHSQCYRLLGLKRGSIVTFKDLLDFGKLHGYEFSRRSDSMERAEPTLRSLGDYYIAFNDWWRQKLYEDPEEAYGEFPAPSADQVMGVWSLDGVHLFIKRYTTWKNRRGLIDFTDMLEQTIDRELSPDPEVMIVDEVQDNSPLQWAITDFWAEGASRLYLAGDEDQALYGWSGAVPDLFLNHPVHKDTLLGQSYRVPGAVHALSQSIITQNRNRKEKIYRPTPRLGEVHYAQNLWESGLEDMDGTIFILARNRFLLDQISEELLGREIPYHNLRGADPLNTGKAIAVMALAALAQDKSISAEALQSVMDYLPASGYLARGFKRRAKALAKESPLTELSAKDIGKDFTKELWDLINSGQFMDALNLDLADKRLLSSALSKGAMDPQVTISTIHGVKGMEADHVIILSDMAGRSYQGMVQDMESERRVWYVGLTRAKQTVTIIWPQGHFYFKFPKF